MPGLDEESAIVFQFEAHHFGKVNQRPSHVARPLAHDQDGQRLVVEQITNPGNGADGGDPTTGHDRHMIGQLLQFIQLMAGDQEALAGVGELTIEGDLFAPPDGSMPASGSSSTSKPGSCTRAWASLTR